MTGRRRFLIVLAASVAVPLTGALFLTLGLVDSLGVVAVAAVLTGLYQLRRSARRRLVYDRRRAGSRRAAERRARGDTPGAVTPGVTARRPDARRPGIFPPRVLLAGFGVAVAWGLFLWIAISRSIAAFGNPYLSS